jgi:CspA family cold shock protein
MANPNGWQGQGQFNPMQMMMQQQQMMGMMPPMGQAPGMPMMDPMQMMMGMMVAQQQNQEPEELRQGEDGAGLLFAGTEAAVLAGRRDETGSMVSWNEGGGFGFINPDEAKLKAAMKGNLFVHRTAMIGEASAFEVGDRVTFDTEVDRRSGKLRAMNVRGGTAVGHKDTRTQKEKKDARANYAEGAKEFVKERAKKVEVEEDYEAKEPEEWEYMAKARKAMKSARGELEPEKPKQPSIAAAAAAAGGGAFFSFDNVAIESIPTSNFASFDDFPTPAPSGGYSASNADKSNNRAKPY